MSTVSVVIPCFELGEFVAAAVDSVRAQTRPPDELVVVDDGSRDAHTLGELERLRAEGVRVMRQDNAGAPAARNNGIAATCGDFVLCLDADDLLLPTYLERTVPRLETSAGAGMVATQVELFGEVRGTWRPGPFSLTSMLSRNCIPSASLFRRRCWEQVGGYRDLPACQDWDFWLSMVERGWEWVVVDEVLYRYRRRRGSISDHREAHREPIMRKFMSLHTDVYQAHWQDVLIELDKQGERWRRQAVLSKVSHPAPPAATPPAARDARGELQALETRAEALRAELAHAESLPAVRTAVAGLPEGARVLVVSRGDEEMVALDGVEASHFPQDHDGVYAGHHPSDDEAAITALELLRARGAEYLVFPPTAGWWLDHYEGLRAHLEARYPVVSRDAGSVVFDVTEYRSFSVVICTHNRADLLGHSIASIFEQRYPREHIELIVVDNASTDETQEVVDALAPVSPVRFVAEVEPELGLSHARNRGIELAGHEYVAFLDDDAITGPHWLRWFNRVINEERALVVGGRVEKAFPEGFEEPEWFRFQYLRHHFGVKYSDRGRPEPTIQIKQPLYLSGGNTAYARRLFEHFGGFDPALGRKGKGLLGAEETYLHMLMQRHGVPMYYSDGAYIEHFVDGWRVTKRHLLKKSYWSGVSQALVHVMFSGYDASERHDAARTELRQRVREVRRAPRDPEAFSRMCRAANCLGFTVAATKLRMKALIGRRIAADTDVTWGPGQWIEEVRRWPESAAKQRQLFELYLEAGDDDAAERALEELTRLNAGAGADEWDDLWGPLEQLRYERLVERVRRTVGAATPPGARIAVVSRGDERLLAIDGREGRHFPQTQGGGYAGAYPGDSSSAIAQVEQVRLRGAEYLVFPHTAMWWLDHYRGLQDHLDERYARVPIDDDRSCVVFALDPWEPPRERPAEVVPAADPVVTAR